MSAAVLNGPSAAPPPSAPAPVRLTVDFGAPPAPAASPDPPAAACASTNSLCMRYSFKPSLCNVSHVLHILRFAVRIDEMISWNRFDGSMRFKSMQATRFDASTPVLHWITTTLDLLSSSSHQSTHLSTISSPSSSRGDFPSPQENVKSLYTYFAHFKVWSARHSQAAM